MSGTIDKLRKSFRIEPDNEVVTVSDGWNAGTAGKFPPLAQQVHILRDVQLFKTAPMLFKPILGLFAVGSRWCRVNSYLSHRRPPGLRIGKMLAWCQGVIDGNSITDHATINALLDGLCYPDRLAGR